MKPIIILKYLSFFLLFILGSFLFAFYFKWRIDPAQTGKAFIIIAGSLMTCWIGVGFLSILISRKLVFKKNDNFNFYNPFQLAINGYLHNEIGTEKAKKFKTAFSLVAFPLFFILVFLFFKITDYYEDYQLENFGQNKEIKIEKILWDKGGQRAFFNFEFEGNKINKIKYSDDSLKVGQKAEIIFSANNPYIIKWKSEILNKKIN